MKRHGALEAVGLLCLILGLAGCGHEHTWTEATCTEPETCTECGETQGEPLGHDWREATCTEPKMCTRCGEMEGEALGHTWDMATRLHPTTCTVCGFTPDETLGDHACDAWEEEQEATCSQEGFRKGICKFCGKEYMIVLEKPDHSFGEWKTVKEPTCQAEGLKKRTCSVCGGEETEALEKPDHDLEGWEAAELPVYGTDGTYTQSCRMCGEVINTKPYTFAELIRDRYSLKGDKNGFTVTDVNLYTYSSGDTTAIHVLAEITNTGDKNISLEKCTFDLNDDQGGLIGTIDDFECIAGPDIIRPGEVGYFAGEKSYDDYSGNIDLGRGIHAFANITVRKTGKEPAVYDVSDVSWSGSDPVCVGRVTNNTGKDADDMNLFVFYQDSAGRIINVGTDYWFDDPLPAGDTRSFSLSSFWFWLNNGGQIKSAKVFAFPAGY